MNGGYAAAVTDLRERRRLRTRHAISSAAVELFAREGYDATSVAQVAEAAEVSPRTVFRHFPDKEELLFGDDELLLAAGLAAIGEAPAGRAVELVRAGIGGVLAELAALEKQIPARAAVIAATPALRARELVKHDRWAAAVAGALADRGVEADRAALVARAGISAATWALGAWVRDGGDVEARVDGAFAVLAEELG
jgi:AcrR family transcriptional regulator